MSLNSQLLAVAALAGLAVAGVALQDSPAASAVDSPRTIELAVGRPAKNTFVDTAKKGESVGDSFITTGVKLRDAATRERVGRLEVLGTIASRRAEFIAITTRLHDGTIQVNGVMRHGKSPVLLAVTGGTGNYANARGTLALNERTGRATFSLLP
jgi:hypothetical protein